MAKSWKKPSMPWRSCVGGISIGAALGFATLPPALAQAAAATQQAPAAEDTRPLSPAQLALFETPHLQNIDHPTTLTYRFVREAPDRYTDSVAVHVLRLNPDGTRDLGFDYLSGPSRIPYPQLVFRGNPLLMLFLEQDATAMKDQLGVAAQYFRDRIRDSFIADATLADTTFTLNGVAEPARSITVRPFAKIERLRRLPSVQAKTYTFVLSGKVPGQIAELRIEMPADPAAGAPAFREIVTFQRETP